MSRQLSAERRKIVLLSSFVACGSGLIGLLAHGHPLVIGAWIFVMGLLLVYVVSQMVKLKKAERLRRAR